MCTRGRACFLEDLAAQRDGYVARVRRWRGAAGDEEDVVHDAFMRAAAGASAVRDVAHGEEWFFRVLRTAYLDHRRRGDARTRMLAEVAAEAALAGPIAPDSPELRCACLRRGLLAIRRDYRTALEIVALEEGTLADLATVAGITPNNAGVRVHRARAALARVTRACCQGCRSRRDGCACGV